jgi:hypothetical protein
MCEYVNDEDMYYGIGILCLLLTSRNALHNVPSRPRTGKCSEYRCLQVMCGGACARVYLLVYHVLVEASCKW